MKDLISVIVPVYNGERYLQRCVESLKRQTYENLEIILIDDGSTDGSRAICGQYRGQKRIRVFHQENCGLAQTRNRGIRLAKGSYIGFCDSDDYVSPFMYSWLYDCIRNGDADIAVCGYGSTSGGEDFVDTPPEAGSAKVYDTLKAFEKLLRGEEPLKSYTWNKLYRRELFQGINYPPEKCYEDQFTTWRLVLKARKVVVSDWKGYHYFRNPESITNRRWNEREMDYLDAWKEILWYCEENHVEYRALVCAQLVSACIYNISRMRKAHVKNIPAERTIRQILADNLKGYWKSDIPAATLKRKFAGYFYGLESRMKRQGCE